MQRNGKTSHTLGLTMEAPEVSVQPPEVLVQPPETPVQPPELQSRTRMARLRRQLGGYSPDARVSQRLLAAQIAIETVQGNPALSARMATRGYDAARLAEGHALHAQAQAQYQHARAGTRAPRAANAARQTAQTQAHAVYMHHVQIARVAFRTDPTAAATLGLAAVRKRNDADWLLQATQFYATTLADPVILTALARYGVAAEELTTAQAQVSAVATLAAAQHRARVAAQQVTAARSTAIATLDAWMRDFLAIARLVLAQSA